MLVDIDKEAFDFQVEDLTPHDPQLGRYVDERIYDTVLPNAIRLVEFFRAQKMPVVFVQWDWHRFQYPPHEPRGRGTRCAEDDQWSVRFIQLEYGAC